MTKPNSSNTEHPKYPPKISDWPSQLLRGYFDTVYDPFSPELPSTSASMTWMDKIRKSVEEYPDAWMAELKRMRKGAQDELERANKEAEEARDILETARRVHKSRKDLKMLEDHADALKVDAYKSAIVAEKIDRLIRAILPKALND